MSPQQQQQQQKQDLEGCECFAALKIGLHSYVVGFLEHYLPFKGFIINKIKRAFSLIGLHLIMKHYYCRVLKIMVLQGSLLLVPVLL